MTRLLRYIPLIAALHCATKTPVDDDQPAGPAPSPSEPSAYDADAYLDPAGAATTADDFDRDWVENTLALVLTSAPTLHASPALAAYRAGIADADAACPSRYSVDGNAFWYADCTSALGTTYTGYAFDYTYTDADLYGDGNLWDASVLSGAATITHGAARFDLSGAAYIAQSQQGDALVSVSDIAGWFEVSGDGYASEGWMADRMQPSLNLYAVTVGGSAPARYFVANGVIGGFAADVPGVSIDKLSFADAAAGYPCTLEPTGTVSLRDPRGGWWQVVFDVNPDTWELSGVCDGCGGVWFQGQQVGEACVDPQALLDWEDAPW